MAPALMERPLAPPWWAAAVLSKAFQRHSGLCLCDRKTDNGFATELSAGGHLRATAGLSGYLVNLLCLLWYSQMLFFKTLLP